MSKAREAAPWHIKGNIPDFPEPLEGVWVVLVELGSSQPPVNVKLTNKSASLSSRS